MPRNHAENRLSPDCLMMVCGIWISSISLDIGMVLLLGVVTASS